MGKNLAKTPLIAIFVATLVYAAMDFLPFSAEYTAAWESAVTPRNSYLIYLGGMLILTIAIVLALSFMQKSIISLSIFALVAPLYLWGLPALPMLWFGDVTKTVTTADILLSLAVLTAGTILALVLTSLLIPGGSSAGSYKLKFPGLIMKILSLPFLYLFMYFVSWHFLGWRHEAVRVFSGGTAEHEHFLQALINLIFRDPTVVPFVLISGLLYLLLTLAILTRFPGQRVVFIVVMSMLSAVGCAYRLISVPWIPEELRFTFFLRDSSVAFIFTLVSATLLHLSCHKQQTAPSPEPKQAAPAGR